MGFPKKGGNLQKKRNIISYRELGTQGFLKLNPWPNPNHQVKKRALLIFGRG